MIGAGALPRLRPLQITPVPLDDGRVFFELRDMLGVAPAPVAVSGAAYFVVAHLDGRHTLADVLRLFRKHTGQELSAADVERLINILDEHCLLETPRFAAALEQARRRYQAAEARDNRDRCPPADALAAQIVGILDGNVPPDLLEIGPVRGIVAPHLDYGRGGPSYAAAYSLLARLPPADRYVILGTNHFGLGAGPVATRKDYHTPLGRAVTDRDFISELERRTGLDLCANEFEHEAEHSVELQVQILQVCYPGRQLRIVPILCPDLCTAQAASDPLVSGSLEALSDALADLISSDQEVTVLIAGADLSHVGLAFGDAERTTPEYMRQVEQTDRQLLSLIERGDCEGFAAALRASGNPTKVCSTGCLYIFARVHRGCRIRLLRYDQTAHRASDTNVTCAAMVAFGA
jgi:AmmeMemoRadiSam system protein B